MSLIADLSAPLAPPPAAHSGPAQPQAAAQAGFSDALERAQEKPGPVAGTKKDDADPKPDDPAQTKAMQAIGAGAEISNRQKFPPVFGGADLARLALTQGEGTMPALPVATPDLAQPPELVVALADPALAIKSMPGKSMAGKVAPAEDEGAETQDLAELPSPALPLPGVVPILPPQPVPVTDHTALAGDGARTVGTGPGLTPAVASSFDEGVSPLLAPVASDEIPAAAPPPEGDLRAALSALIGPMPLSPPPEVPTKGAADMPAPGVEIGADLVAEAKGRDLPEEKSALAEDPGATTADMPQDMASQVTVPGQAVPGLLASPAAPMAIAASPAHAALRMDQPDWPEKLAVRLAAAFDANQASIEMQLSPEHLGPLHIRLEMKSGVAQVFVTTATPQAAEAFARAEPQLSSLLAASDVTLGGHDTASGGFADPGGQPGGRGFQGQPVARFAHPDLARAAAPEAGPARLLNLIA